jgi:hypothetical protein
MGRVGTRNQAVISPFDSGLRLVITLRQSTYIGVMKHIRIMGHSRKIHTN